MADVLNRTTVQLLLSVNTPDYPVIDWIHNPDLTDVEGVPQKFWKIEGDIVTEMSPAEKTIVQNQLDADQLEQEKIDATDEDNTGDANSRRILGFMETMVDEINILRANAGIPPQRTLQDYKDSVRNNIENQTE